jgi:hypothetical protein
MHGEEGTVGRPGTRDVRHDICCLDFDVTYASFTWTSSIMTFSLNQVSSNAEIKARTLDAYIVSGVASRSKLAAEKVRA